MRNKCVWSAVICSVLLNSGCDQNYPESSLSSRSNPSPANLGQSAVAGEIVHCYVSPLCVRPGHQIVVGVKVMDSEHKPLPGYMVALKIEDHVGCTYASRGATDTDETGLVYFTISTGIDICAGTVTNWPAGRYTANVYTMTEEILTTREFTVRADCTEYRFLRPKAAKDAPTDTEGDK